MEEIERRFEGKEEQEGEGKSRQGSLESKGHGGGDVEGKERSVVM